MSDLLGLLGRDPGKATTAQSYAAKIVVRE